MRKFLCITALLLVGCQSVMEASETQVIDVSDGDTIEISPQIVSKEIAGKSVRMYGYNGQMPGPTIRAVQGSTITVHTTNNIDHETTIHWHGLRHDVKDDGVPGISQDPIAPGESYTYTLSFPDAGIFWYHPHVREDLQQDMGLYGVIDVRNANEERDPPLVHQEEILVLDDVLLDTNSMVPHGKDEPNLALMGRFGNEILVNMQPAGTYNIDAKKSSIVRLHLVNTANTRTFRLVLDGARMKRVYGDIGAYVKQEFVDSITIAPAERYSVDVLLEDSGTVTIRHESPLAEVNLATITVTDEEVGEYPTAAIYEEEHIATATKEEIEIYRPYFDNPVDKSLLLDIEMDGSMGIMHEGMEMHHDETGIEWEDTMPMMNQMMASEDFQWKLIDEQTGKQNMDIDWSFTQGDVAIVSITNIADSAHPMQHPIHFHGQRFLVLSDDNLVWKDTVLVPIGQTVKLLFDMSNPGEWMMHCHIAEHLSNGMMGKFTVK